MEFEKKKIYILYNWFNEEILAVSFDKNVVLARAGLDAMAGEDTDGYCLKSTVISDLNDEEL